jgi:hypothetical protein
MGEESKLPITVRERVYLPNCLYSSVKQSELLSRLCATTSTFHRPPAPNDMSRRHETKKIASSSYNVPLNDEKSQYSNEIRSSLAPTQSIFATRVLLEGCSLLL